MISEFNLNTGDRMMNNLFSCHFHLKYFLTTGLKSINLANRLGRMNGALNFNFSLCHWN